MLHIVSWLIRAAAFVVIGTDVLSAAAPGPVALPLTVAAYALCGVLLACWAVLDRPLRARAVPAVPLLLGVLAATAAALSMRDGASSMAGIAGIATIDAATQSRLSTGWSVFGAAVAAVAATAPFSGASTEKAFTIALALAVGLLAGLNRRAFRVRAEQNAVLLTQAEELRAEQRRGAVLDERARIAREIHDILAHSLGALGIQIQAARALIGDHGDTARAQEVLDVAQRLAADGLADTRRAVHALRTDTLPLPDELAAMARAHRERHGCEVTVRVDGEPSPLPADQAVALVRTAQEALVNAAKYAPGRPVGITLAYSGDDVTMTVGNLLGASAPGTFTTVNGGYGLTGIRERLLLLGGTLCVGREPDGGGERWTLAARVPR